MYMSRVETLIFTESSVPHQTRLYTPPLCTHVTSCHPGKSVPIVKGGEATRMEEGEFYAIETFGR
jgi:hypothetical protein